MVSISASRHSQNFLALLARQPAVLVQVEATQGSVPREAGAWMAVFGDAVVGTIGGGNLEFQAIAQARAMLNTTSQQRQPAASTRFALGPALGQCCGGVMQLRFEPVSPSDVPALAEGLGACRTWGVESENRPQRGQFLPDLQAHSPAMGQKDGEKWTAAVDLQPTIPKSDRLLGGGFIPVALFGGGHVGHALVQVLAPLPFQVTWIDSRDAVFPESVPAWVVCEHSGPPQAAVAGLAPRSRVLIMSFSHAEDLDVVTACLERQRQKADLPYIGLIGSKTKWATFRHRLEARGFTPAELAHVTCPIGIAGITGKEPEVIAVAVAAQLLQTPGQF